MRQARRWESTGCDQLVFRTGHVPKSDTLGMIRLMVEYVIPKVDKDPMHRTSRFRDAAK